jgi:mono/diheme cytochrome c family protein
MIKKSLLAGAILALPALALAPRGTTLQSGLLQSGPLYVPVAHADDAKEPTDEELAKNAWAVLEKHCTACHGEGKGKYRAAPIDKGTLSKLIEKKQIVPGKPDESPVYTLMIDHDDPMPPKRVQVRPTEEEINSVKVWIEKGAPAWPTEEKKD